MGETGGKKLFRADARALRCLSPLLGCDAYSPWFIIWQPRVARSCNAGLSTATTARAVLGAEMVGGTKAYRNSKPFQPVELVYPLPLPPPARVPRVSGVPRVSPALGLPIFLSLCLPTSNFRPAESPHEQGLGRAPAGLVSVRGIFSSLGTYR